MRPRFEGDLRNMNEVAKDELEIEAGGENDVLNIEAVLDWHLEKAAEKQHTDILVQKEIYDIQKKKQNIMQQLKNNLSCIDNPDCEMSKQEGFRDASYQDGNFVYTDDKGQKWIATFGDVLSDISWGINYNLDKQSTPRNLLKKYLVESAKKEIQELLDNQIIKSEVGGDFTDNMKKRAYHALEEEKMTGVLDNRWGFVSEKIVKSFLLKMSVDSELPFTIVEADVFQDVEQKIDFIIHRKDRNRGVGVDASENVKDIGVQFSVNLSAEQKKKHQIGESLKKLRKNNESIQDIALVIFPLNMASDLKRMWEDVGRPSGGPDRYIERRVAESLFKTILKDIFNPTEIDEYWEKVKDNFYN